MSVVDTMSQDIELTSICPVCNHIVDLDEPCATCASRKVVDSRLGMVVADRYEIVSPLGSGGMGSVYRAMHLELFEPVAVKFLHPGTVSSPMYRTRFRREAVALARVRHPNIVSLLDFGEHLGELYMVMELVAGKPLSHAIARGPLDLPRTVKIFHEVLQVLEVAHAAGIVHRDIKPDNVMLLAAADGMEHVKVLDFGLAHLGDSSTKDRVTLTGMAQGTPLYMSPEQCRGEVVGGATDIYAVGIMLFEALTQVVPFTGDHPAPVMAKHLFVQPPRMSSVGAHRQLSDGFEEIVQRALAKEASQRPTAAEMRTMLSDALAGTDRSSVLKRATEERRELLHLPREDRALSRTDETPTRPPAKHTTPNGEVVLWMPVSPEALDMGLVLEVNLLAATVDGESALPGPKTAMIVVQAEPEGLARTRALRASAAHARTPILVVNATASARVAELIRAGASDVILAADGTGDVLRRVKRLLRRGR